MAQIYIPPLHAAIFAEVARRGYRVDHRARGIVALNEADGKPRKTDGLERRKPLPYTFHESHLYEIERSSFDAAEGADRVIAICRTNKDPGPGTKRLSQSELENLTEQRAKKLIEDMGLTPELIAKLVHQKNRAAEEPAPQPIAKKTPKKKKKKKIVTDLTDREWQAIELRDQGKTIREVAAEMGVSHTRVHQLYKRGKAKLGQQAS